MKISCYLLSGITSLAGAMFLAFFLTGGEWILLIAGLVPLTVGAGLYGMCRDRWRGELS